MPESSLSPDVRSSEEISFEKSTLEKIIGIPFTPDNRVTLLESGRETFRKILGSVSGAEEIICIEFYIFRDDDTGKKLAGLLKEKAGQGVRVYLLYDHFGSFLTSSRFWSGLKRAGIRVKVSHPFRWNAPRGYLYRNHKKLLIIDGKVAFAGGFNIADEYYGSFRKRAWRDTGIYLEGPIASTLLRIFSRSWKTWKGESIRHDETVQAVADGVPVLPIFVSSARSRRRMRKLLIHSIRHAESSIFITTAYFIPGRKILKALIFAAKRGVEVKLLLPGQSDVTSVFYAGRSYYTKLLKAGVEIYNYHDSVLHSKTAVFDGCWSIVGSTNLDAQSLRRNEESNVGILDRGFSQEMIRTFMDDLQNSVRIELGEWVRRPFYQKVLEKIFLFIMKRLL